MGKKIQCIGRYTMDGVTLGKGNFAHVELATHKITEVKVAIKIIDTRKIKEEYVRANLHREARIMASLRHPNIIRLYETLKATTLYCLVTEYASGGELLAYIKSQKDCRLGESASRPFIRQLLSAIHYLHERGVVHRDLKMENIMLNEKQKSIKLIDFGLSNIYKDDELLKTHCGSPEYAAPELFDGSKAYGPEIDIWSFGIIMYAMVLGRLPFCTPFKDEYHRQRMLQQIHKGLSPVHDREMQPLSADCRNLLHQLIEPNAQLRIPLPEIICHPWVTKNGKCPFVPYTPPPKNKMLRNQIVSALAIMMDMKKGVVNETVKENRADELSAMFNMMMDNRKRIMGLCDYDHTRPPRSRSSRSRSGDRENTQTPESSGRLGARHQVSGAARKTLTATGGAAMGKKAGAGSKVKPKNRPLPKNSTHGTATTKPGAAGSRNPTGAVSTSGLTTSHSTTGDIDRPSALTQHHASGVIQTLAAAGIHPGVRIPSRRHGGPALAGSVAAALGALSGLPAAAMAAAGAGQQAANGPTRLPLSQRRDPPPKLSMTLDLSVTNPRLSSKTGAERGAGTASASGVGGGTTPVAVLRRRDAVVPDSSFGIAASSGVPPRMSPKEYGKDVSKIPVLNITGATSSSGESQSSAVNTTTNALSVGSAATASGLLRARRPSSLQYCLKSTAPRLAPPPATPPEDEENGTEQAAADAVLAATIDQKPSRQLSVPGTSETTAVAVEVVDRLPIRRSSGTSSKWGHSKKESAVACNRIVAPKATPEDSIIDSCSTADDDDNDYHFSSFAASVSEISERRPACCSTTTVAATIEGAEDQFETGSSVLNVNRSSFEVRRMTSNVGIDDFDEFDDEIDEDEDDDDDDDNDSVRNDAELCRDEVPPTSSVGLRPRNHPQHKQRRSMRASRSASPDPFRLADVLAARAIVESGGGSCDPAGFPLRHRHWVEDSHSDGMETLGSGSLPGCLPLGTSASPFASSYNNEDSSFAGGKTMMTLPRLAGGLWRPARIGEGSCDTVSTLTPAESNHSSLSAESSSTMTLSRRDRQRRSPPNLSMAPATNRRTADNGYSSQGSEGIGESAGRLINNSAAGAAVKKAAVGISPSSPSYDVTHAKFSHLGSHALDVFFSPDCNDDDDGPNPNDSPLVEQLKLSAVSLSSAAPIHTVPSTVGTLWRPVVGRSSAATSRPCSSLSSMSTGLAMIDQSPVFSTSSAALIAPIVGPIEGLSEIDDDDVEEVRVVELSIQTVRSMTPLSSRSPDEQCSSMLANVVDCRTCPPPVVVASAPVCSKINCSASSVLTAVSTSNSSTTVCSTAATAVKGSLPTRRVSADDAPSAGCRRFSRTSSAVGSVECCSSLTNDDGGSATWLMLPEVSSSHRDGHSPSTSVVWPAETIRTRVKASSPQVSTSSGSQVSVTHLGDVESSPEKRGSLANSVPTTVTSFSSQNQLATSTTAHSTSTTVTSTNATGAKTEQRDCRTSKTKSATSASTPDSSRIPRLTTSIKRRLPALSSLLDRKGSSGDIGAVVLHNQSTAVRKEDKRVLKSSLESSTTTTTTTRLLTSSWRQGLTHWLQMSRASAASVASTVASSNSPTSTNNNVVDGSPTSNHQRRGSSTKRRRQGSNSMSQYSDGHIKASAPMTISVVSNHGHVRMATGFTLPNAARRRTSSVSSSTAAPDVVTTVPVISPAVTFGTEATSTNSSVVCQYAPLSSSDAITLSTNQPDAVHNVTTTPNQHHQHHHHQQQHQQQQSISSSKKLFAVQSQVRSLLDVIDAARGVSAQSTSPLAPPPAMPHGGLPGGSPSSTVLRQPQPPSRSPLCRLRTRKVQWQECEKCARSDHSSDESADSAVLSPLSAVESAPHMTSTTAALINTASHRLLANAPENNGRQAPPPSPQPLVANNISASRLHSRHT